MEKVETFIMVLIFNLMIFLVAVAFVIFEYCKRRKLYLFDKKDQEAEQSLKVRQLSLSSKDTISRNILDHLKVGGPKHDTKLAINLLYSSTAIDKAKNELLKKPGGVSDLDTGACSLRIVYNPSNASLPVFSVKYAANKSGSKTVRQHSIAEEAASRRDSVFTEGSAAANVHSALKLRSNGDNTDDKDYVDDYAEDYEYYGRDYYSEPNETYG